MNMTAGILKTSGNILSSKNPVFKEKSIVFQYRVKTHVDTLIANDNYNKNNNNSTNNKNNNRLIKKCKSFKDRQATHVVSALTYGIDCWVNFKRPIKLNESSRYVESRLRDVVEQLSRHISIQSTTKVGINESFNLSHISDEFVKDVTVDVYIGHNNLLSVNFQQAVDITTRIQSKQRLFFVF